MSFDTSWNVDKYFNHYEPEEQWELKKKFLMFHKNRFPEADLVTLAGIFIRIVILGYEYGEELTGFIEKLSKGVIEDYRARKMEKLCNVFAQASDAAAKRAEAQAKSKLAETQKRSATEEMESCTIDADTNKTSASRSISAIINAKNEKFRKATDRKGGNNKTSGKESTNVVSAEREVAAGTTDDVIIIDDYYEIDSDVECIKEKKESEALVQLKEEVKVMKSDAKPKVADVKKQKIREGVPVECNTPFGYMVLIDLDEDKLAKQKLERSASLCGAKLTVIEEESISGMTIIIFLHNVKLASATDLDKKKAKEMAYQIGVAKLQEMCYTIKVVRKLAYSVSVGKDFVGALSGGTSQDQFRSGNKASKMLASMGLIESNPLKAEQGIEEPVGRTAKPYRSGFGHNLDQAEIEKFHFQQCGIQFLKQYANSGSEQDLIFNSDFSNEERKVLYRLAGRFDLKARNYGKGKERHLIISAKIKPFNVVKKLLTPGSSSERFELVKPNLPCKQDELL